MSGILYLQQDLNWETCTSESCDLRPVIIGYARREDWGTIGGGKASSSLLHEPEDKISAVSEVEINIQSLRFLLLKQNTGERPNGQVVAYCASTPQVRGSILELGKVNSSFIPPAVGR
ncbi:hypothetical protein TNCV_1923941 [Trichonephila clavipes]|nr:hypothetical protein TNCV_1923941 [Trichonephila clavipes]